MFWLLLLIGLASADDNVITINKGEPAPFTGTLLSPSAAARLLATGESELSLCQANSQRQLQLKESEFQLSLSNKEAELAACTLKFNEYERIYLDQINYLEKRSVTPAWEKPVLFIGGVAIGISTVALSAWVLDKIGD
ncbi:MAG: hypothetical protein CBC29_07095 [Methylococcaceae bacterium TMED69]|nr:MAG: hypothetical protein CBC29_07095 [Methylococcaceae bacterium TMED69]|tara:strand:+ start:1736 stop:2149 length:414 start_codon:yes stop_codon:yes gene_type:complete